MYLLILLVWNANAVISTAKLLISENNIIYGSVKMRRRCATKDSKSIGVQQIFGHRNEVSDSLKYG